MTKVVTFYSYKGGVGRTMALVNSAYCLARDGKRVLLDDFDLEAPGMTYFLSESDRNRPASVRLDAIDLLLHAKEHIGAGWKQPIDFLNEYVVNVDSVIANRDRDDVPQSTLYRGRIDLMPAHFESASSSSPEPDADYLRRLDRLDLSGVFSAKGPRHAFGDFVRSYFTQARFRIRGDNVFALRSEIVAGYDIVLIDSRTGLNEISGLCIGPLCDGIVVCCGLNEQNILGTRYFMRSAGLLGKDAKSFVVAAGPIPAWQSKVARERIEKLKKALRGAPVVEVPYHPGAALEERFFVKDDPDDPIAAAYERLAPRAGTVGDNPNDSEALVERLGRALGDETAGIEPWLELAEGVLDMASRRRFEEPGQDSIVDALSFFPTAVALQGLPSRSEGLKSERFVERAAIAAAVAAYRNKTARPFDEMWERYVVRGRAPGASRHLAIRLMYFEAITCGTEPAYSGAPAILNGALEEILGRPRLYRSDSEAVDVASTAFLFERRFDWKLGVASSELRRWLERRGVEQGNWRYRTILLRPGRDWFRPNFDRWSQVPQLMASHGRTSPREVAAWKKVIVGHHGMSEVEAGYRGSKAQTFVEDVRERARFSGLDNQVLPLGFWPEIVMATGTAITKGVDGLRDVLFWLEMARLNYGYAWRVLVDWTHFKSIVDRKAFRDFLEAEDVRVEAVESRINDGQFAL